MDMTPGYIYALANSSMPGLVKVGKTTRLPSDRAVELSGVTGVATPFIVVYEEYFDDCDNAEAHIHALLTAKGVGVSEGREFFRASVSEVVKTIVEVTAVQDTVGDCWPAFRTKGLGCNKPEFQIEVLCWAGVSLS